MEKIVDIGWPWHAAVVHLPMGIVFLLPVVTLMLLVLFRRKLIQRTAFLLLVFIHLVLTGLSYVALGTGENSADRHQQAGIERELESHRERGETFLVASLFSVIVALIFVFLPMGRFSSMGLGILLGVQLALMFLGYRVHDSGLRLVYAHGAAQVYLPQEKRHLLPAPIEGEVPEDGPSEDSDQPLEPDPKGQNE